MVANPPPGLYTSGQFLYIKKPVIATATTPPPPRVCPSATFVCLPFASFKAEDLQKKHSSRPKIFMGQAQYRNRV